MNGRARHEDLAIFFPRNKINLLNFIIRLILVLQLSYSCVYNIYLIIDLRKGTHVQIPQIIVTPTTAICYINI